MSKLDEKVGKYIEDVRQKIGEEPDVDLLRKIAESIGPSIFKKDAETVAFSDKSELETIKNGFLKKKLKVSDERKMGIALEDVKGKYGENNRNKYRVVVYYLLTKYFNRDYIFNT